MRDSVHAVGRIDQRFSYHRAKIQLVHNHTDGTLQKKVDLIKMMALINRRLRIGIDGMINLKFPASRHLVTKVPHRMVRHIKHSEVLLFATFANIFNLKEGICIS